MKKILSLSIIAALSISFTACKKNYDTVSVVKTIPTIAINGDRFITINVGGTFTDQGATFVGEDGQSSNITADSNSVNTAVPGLYIVNYSRTTESTFEAADARYVAVTNISNALNLSGEYLRAATGAQVIVTRMSRGLYRTSDFGGAPTLRVVAYFAQINDTTIVAPPQPTANVGTIAGTNGRVRINGSDTSYSYAVVNPSFGTAVRTFVKQ